MTQPLPEAQLSSAENELDIRGLFRALWSGKHWIIGLAVLFAVVVLIYTFFARQETAPASEPAPGSVSAKQLMPPSLRQSK